MALKPTQKKPKRMTKRGSTAACRRLSIGVLLIKPAVEWKWTFDVLLVITVTLSNCTVLPITFESLFK